MIKNATACFIIIIFTSCSITPKTESPYIEMLHYGVMISDKNDVSYTLSEDSTSGRITHARTSAVCETTDIPLVHDTSFGIMFRLLGIQSTRDMIIPVITTFPKMMLPDGRILTASHWENTVYHDEVEGYIGEANFVFEEDYEMLEGEWSVSIKFGTKTISKKFNVSKNNTIKISDCKKAKI